jgi:endonuclease YncB( thermonuclease family)
MMSTRLSLICLVVLTCASCGGDGSDSDTSNNPTTGAKVSDVARTSEKVSSSIKGTVVHISDGDTFIVEDEQGKRTTVRIHAIDAPELSQEFGKESREALRALIANQQVEVREHNKDQYRRSVGQVFLDGKDIGLEQVASGNAWHFKQYEKEQPAEERQAYTVAEKSARDSRLGIWRNGIPEAPQDYRRTHENPREHK